VNEKNEVENGKLQTFKMLRLGLSSWPR